MYYFQICIPHFSWYLFGADMDILHRGHQQYRYHTKLSFRRFLLSEHQQFQYDRWHAMKWSSTNIELNAVWNRCLMTSFGTNRRGHGRSSLRLSVLNNIWACINTQCNCRNLSDVGIAGLNPFLGMKFVCVLLCCLVIIQGLANRTIGRFSEYGFRETLNTEEAVSQIGL
jgi:hypothetical protein